MTTKIDINKKYQYRNGDAARILCIDGPDNAPVVAIGKDGISSHTETGRSSRFADIECGYDLIEVVDPEPKQWELSPCASDPKGFCAYRGPELKPGVVTKVVEVVDQKQLVVSSTGPVTVSGPFIPVGSVIVERPLRLEAGKSYVNRRGEVVGPLEINEGNFRLTNPFRASSKTFREDGGYWTNIQAGEDPDDLVTEHIAPQSEEDSKPDFPAVGTWLRFTRGGFNAAFRHSIGDCIQVDEIGEVSFRVISEKTGGKLHFGFNWRDGLEPLPTPPVRPEDSNSGSSSPNLETDSPNLTYPPDESEWPDAIASLRNQHEIQGQHGNWNCDPYMHGMFNGLELALAQFENRPPDFRKAPDVWLLNPSDDDHLGIGPDLNAIPAPQWRELGPEDIVENGDEMSCDGIQWKQFYYHEGHSGYTLQQLRQLSGIFTHLARRRIQASDHVDPVSGVTVPGEKSEEWRFCPECGCEKNGQAIGFESTHRYCEDCGQEWHQDIDYLDVVRKNLYRLFRDQAPPAERKAREWDAVIATAGNQTFPEGYLIGQHREFDRPPDQKDAWRIGRVREVLDGKEGA